MHRGIKLTSLFFIAFLVHGFEALDCSSSSDPGNPIAKDLVDGFKLNLLKFRSLRVSIVYTHQLKAGWIQDKQFRITQLQRKSDSMADGLEKSDLVAAIQELRNAVIDPNLQKAKVRSFDFWTNRRGFQLRKPIGAEIEKGSIVPFGFPDQVGNADELFTFFKDVEILSFKEAPSPSFRSWTGVKANGTPTGIIRTAAPEQKEGWVFPPLGVTDESWGKSNMWHEIDGFYFSTPLSSMSVSGPETFGDHKIYKLKSFKEMSMKEYWSTEMEKKYEGRVKLIKTITAFVDPLRGYLPWQVEWEDFTILVEDGKIYSSKNGPQHKLVVEQIEEIAGAGFYPTAGRVENLKQILSDEILDKYNYDDYLRGKYAQGRALHEETKWQVSKINANIDLESKMFDLSFPPHTQYLDEASMKLMSTTNQEPRLNAVIDSLKTPPVFAKSNDWRLVIVVVNIVVLTLIIIGYWALRRQRQSP